MVDRQPRTFDELLTWVTSEINLLKRRRVPRILGPKPVVERAEGGTSSAGFLSAGTSRVVHISLDPPFDRVPVVTVSRRFPLAWGGVYTTNETVNGFDLHYECLEAHTLNSAWTAFQFAPDQQDTEGANGTGSIM